MKGTVSQQTRLGRNKEINSSGTEFSYTMYSCCKKNPLTANFMSAHCPIQTLLQVPNVRFLAAEQRFEYLPGGFSRNKCLQMINRGRNVAKTLLRPGTTEQEGCTILVNA